MRDAVRAKTEYNSFARSDNSLLKSQQSPPTLPKPAKKRSVESESLVNGCEKPVLENGKEKITINGEMTAIGSDEEVAASQEITGDSREEGTETDQPDATNSSCDMLQLTPQGPSAMDASTDAPSNSTS